MVKEKPSELDFRANWLYDRYVEERKRYGFHGPEFHNDPMKVPPPVRADGKTRCEACRLDMGPFESLDASSVVYWQGKGKESKTLDEAWAQEKKR